MPVYEFACGACGQRFEEFTWSSTDANATTCPSCGSTNARKLMSVFGIGRADIGRADAPIGPTMSGPAPSMSCGPGCGCHAPAPRRLPTSVS